MKLTTDRYEASRGLFATAELLVLSMIILLTNDDMTVIIQISTKITVACIFVFLSLNVPLFELFVCKSQFKVHKYIKSLYFERES